MPTDATMARRVFAFPLMALILVALTGCQPIAPAAAEGAPVAVTTPRAAVEPVSANAPLTMTLAPAQTAPISAEVTLSATAPVTITASPLTITEALTITQALTVSEALTVTAEPTATTPITEIVILTRPTPVLLEIPAINLTAPVEVMGWEIVSRGGQRTTRWVLPEDAAGWHANSARAGEAGTTVISGRQMDGAAVFAPLALGEVEPGQEIFLTDSEGARFRYRVSDVPDPLPVRGGDAAAAAAAADYIAPDAEGRLVLITGWPAFTTTHRQFVLADLVGPAE